MIALQKAKTYGKDALQFKKDKLYWVSTKYDGNCIKIVQDGSSTRWFTSNDKEFTLPIVMPEGHYTAIAEFMYGCEGKLGDRGNSAILTTLRTDFAKGKKSSINLSKVNIKIFDFIHTLEGTNFSFQVRMNNEDLIWPEGVSQVSFKQLSGLEAIFYAKALAADGWEGVMLMDPKSKYYPGKRVHHAIKMKFRQTADLLCIGVDEGQGKCNGIGALILRDSVGRIVRVGSGLDYSGETREGSQFLGKVIEIEYEQILDTYIQPVFVSIREDKTVEETD